MVQKSSEIQVKKSSAMCLEGLVVSDKMEKTIVVQVERSVRHPKYGKIVTMKKKYKVHDPESLGKVGNFVRIKMSAPISKTKNMVLDAVLRQ
jgi:small subunit ribosomal protein S17